VLAVLALAVHPVAVTRVQTPGGVVVTERSGRSFGPVFTPPAVEPFRPMHPAPPRPPAPPATVVMSRKPMKFQPKEDPPPQFVWDTTIESLPRVSPSEAREDALSSVRNRLTHELRLSVVPTQSFFDNKDKDNKEKEWIKLTWDEEPGPDVDGTSTTKVKLTAKLTAQGWTELARREQSNLAQQRLELTGRGLAVLTALLGAIAGYIRLDEWTKGYYTGRLRLAAVVVVALAALAVIA
jgi:hypothetical protein